MATATSTVVNAIAALIAAINTQSAVTSSTTQQAPPLVKKGAPGPNQPDDLIIVGELVSQRYTPDVFRGDGGSGWLQEDYTISVVVNCYRGGDNPDDALTRCEVLVNAVDDAVRNDPSLAGAVLIAYPSAHDYSVTWEPDHKGWIAQCDMYVTCMAKP